MDMKARPAILVRFHAESDRRRTVHAARLSGYSSTADYVRNLLCRDAQRVLTKRRKNTKQPLEQIA